MVLYLHFFTNILKTIDTNQHPEAPPVIVIKTTCLWRTSRPAMNIQSHFGSFFYAEYLKKVRLDLQPSICNDWHIFSLTGPPYHMNMTWFKPFFWHNAATHRFLVQTDTSSYSFPLHTAFCILTKKLNSRFYWPGHLFHMCAVSLHGVCGARLIVLLSTDSSPWVVKPLIVFFAASLMNLLP